MIYEINDMDVMKQTQSVTVDHLFLLCNHTIIYLFKVYKEKLGEADRRDPLFAVNLVSLCLQQTSQSCKRKYKKFRKKT